MSTYMTNCADLGTWDVVIVGSGAAGTTAAIAAGRQGARVLLVERLPFLGGISTAVLDTIYGFYTPGSRSIKVVGGIPDRIVEGLGRYGQQFERPNTFGSGTGITYHPEYLKVVMEDLVVEAGVRVLLHAQVIDAVVKDRRVTGLVVATKAGLGLASATVVIDASGDADICHHAHCGYELAGEGQPAQTLTTTFKMVNVDVAKRTTVTKARFHALMADAADRLGYRLPRKEGSDHVTPVEHMTATIMTRMASYRQEGGRTINATDPYLLSEAEMEGRRQALEYIRFLRDLVPGYERAALACFSTQIGVRETRRVHGDYRLTREDVLEARQFDDQIGLCGAPIEDHHGGADTAWHYLPDGCCVGIPMRTLVVHDADNLLVAGRCFSSTHDAHASVRSIGQCMAMGQAAGIASALALSAAGDVRRVPFDRLRERLLASGAVLQVPA